MFFSSLLVLALAVFGASAQTLVSSGLNGCGVGFNGITGINGFSGFNNLNGLTGVNGVSAFNGINGLNTVNAVNSVASTPVLENVPLRLPSIVHPPSIQESCNCIKTIVRPQIRKEVFTIPSIQRFLQTTSTPVVETLPFVTGSSTDVPAIGNAISGIETGLIGNGVSGFGSGLTGGLVSGVNTGVGIGLSNVVSGVNTGFNGLTNVVSGINSGFGSNF